MNEGEEINLFSYFPLYTIFPKIMQKTYPLFASPRHDNMIVDTMYHLPTLDNVSFFAYNDPMEKNIYTLKNKNLKKQASKLYSDGYSLREIGNILGRSHETIRLWLLDELSTGAGLDKV